MKFSFGKYKGIEFEQVLTADRGYFEWAMNSAKEGISDPQWGHKNKERYDAMAELLNTPTEVTTIFNEEIPVTNISKAIDNAVDSGNELAKINARLDELYDMLSACKWHLEGGTAVKTAPTKPKDPVDINWEE